MLPTTAPQILDQLLSRTRAALQAFQPPRPHLVAALDRLAARQRPALLMMVEQAFAWYFERQAKAPAASSKRLLGALLTPKERTEANLRALALLASWMREGSAALQAPDAQQVLAAYSGWGGLSIEKIRSKLPPELPAPEKRGLIHEYYTPPAVADAIARELVRLAPPPRAGSKLQVLEPSAGIGRFVDALEGAFPANSLRWELVEYSAVSAKLLSARFFMRDPSRFRVHAGSFESWAKDYPLEETDPDLQFDLIASNPPYGPRGASLAEDGLGQHFKASYPYFVWRSLGLLAPGGVAVYLIPGGMMTGTGKRLMGLREDVLKRAHLLGAFRMPSETPDGKEAVFPGANLVTDVIFLQRRPANLGMVPPSDQRILDGHYFKDHPSHILGEEFGEDHGEDDQSKKPRWGFGVRGRFEGFPAWTPRPLQGDAPPADEAPKESTAQRKRRTKGSVAAQTPASAQQGEEASDPILQAERLGLRAAELLAAASRGDTARLSGWEELRADLSAWSDQHGTPHKHPGLLQATRSRGLERFLAAYEPRGGLTAAWTTPPQAAQARYQGAKDLLALASWLHRDQGGRMTLAELVAFAAQHGVTLARQEVRRQLAAASWCVDDSELEALWHPKADYLQGDLWPRYDAALRLAEQGDEQAARQVEWLLEVIQPVIAADILDQLSPRDSWLPLDAVWDWIKTGKPTVRGVAFELGKARGLVRAGGGVITVLVQDGYDEEPRLLPYHELPTSDKERTAARLDRGLMVVLGYLNHDLAFFSPPVKKVLNPETGNEETENLDEVRVEVAGELVKNFRAWLQGQEDHQRAVEEAYNRAFKGYIPVTYPPDPVEIARWNPAYKLHPYQNIALRRMLAPRRGLLAFDVGLGKTFTGIALIARARQEGWARRPVVVVPNSIVWKWHRDFKKVLPDYRVLVIGSSINSRGTAVTDASDVRARKWAEFAAGRWDVVLLTESMIGSTRVLPSTLEDYTRGVSAIRRFIQLQRAENEKKKEQAAKRAEKKAEKKATKGKTERAEAVEEEAGTAWVLKMLAGNVGTDYDPGLTWEEIGCDLLMVDEAQGYKGLFGLGDREGGMPEGVGSTNPSKKAWHLDFRAHAVRQRSGGAGVFLLSATPAKNSPVELYNLVHMVDPGLWERSGITDPEAFFDHFCELSFTTAQRADSKIVVKSAVKAFRNLDNLRALLARYTEFKTAEDVGLKIPEALNRGTTPEEFIDLSGEQRETIRAMIDEIARIQDKMKHLGPEDGAVRQAMQMKIMGIASRIDMVSIHPELANLRSEPDPLDAESSIRYTDAELEARARALPLRGVAPKLELAAERILDTRRTTCELSASDDGCCLSCGHVVFADNQGVHYMVERLLIEGGIPPERIAILNGHKAKDPETRQRIAMSFNGVGCQGDPEHLPPVYDVVIANRVAYEGVDLQRRTCMIHHLDLPWEPATLQQRNGRGVRQGNLFPDVEVHYYLARGSLDLRRLMKLQNKAGWLSQLFSSTARTTNNPMAKVELSAEEIILELGSEEAKAQVRAKMADQEAERQKQLLINQRRMGNRLLGQAHERFRRAERAATPQSAASYRKEAEELLAQLAKLPPAAWAWHDQAPRVREERAYIPAEGPPLFEGDRWLVGAHRVEIGAIKATHPLLLIEGQGGRALGWGTPSPKDEELLRALAPAARLPALTDEEAAQQAALEVARINKINLWSGSDDLSPLGWHGASRRYREAHGALLAERIALRLQAMGGYTYYTLSTPLPLVRAGQLEPFVARDYTESMALLSDLQAGRVSILPPSPSGLAAFRALLPAARERFKASELEVVTLGWWDTKLIEVQRG